MKLSSISSCAQERSNGSNFVFLELEPEYPTEVALMHSLAGQKGTVVIYQSGHTIVQFKIKRRKPE